MAKDKSAPWEPKRDKPAPWAVEDRLLMPPDPPGYKLKWIRIKLRGEADKLDLDYKNLALKKREGWEFIRPEDLDEEWKDFYEVFTNERIGSVVIVDDVALAKMPLEWWNERREYFQNKHREQEHAARMIQLESAGVDTRKIQEVMPVFDQSKQTVTRGRQPSFD